MINVLLVVILVVIVGSICNYLYKQKKKGNHCIGCPYSGQCGKKSCNSKFDMT